MNPFSPFLVTLILSGFLSFRHRTINLNHEVGSRKALPSRWRGYWGSGIEVNMVLLDFAVIGLPGDFHLCVVCVLSSFLL